jgi:UDP-N-acetylglucosamine 2-epimerase
MFVKILIYKDKKLNEKLKTFLNSIQEPFQITVTSYQLNEDLVKQGFNSNILSDIFPYDHPKYIEIDTKVEKTLTQYKKLFKNIKYNNFEIFDSIQNSIADSLNSLYQYENLIKSNINHIFIFSSPNFSHLVLQNKALDDPNIDNLSFLDPNLNLLSPYEFYSMIKLKEKNFSKILNKLTKLPFFSSTLSYFIFHKIKNKISKQFNKSPSPVDFFLTPSSHYVYGPTIQLQKKLSQNKIFYRMFSFDNETPKILKNEDFNLINLFKISWIFSQIIKNSKEYLDMTKKIHKIILENEIKILKLNNLTNPLLDQLPFNVSIMIIIEKFFEQNKPKSVIVSNDGNRIGNSIVSSCRSNNICTFSIPALTISSTPMSKFLFTTDKICLYGNHAKNILLRLGYDDKRLFLAGNPKYDYIPKSNFSNSKNKLSKLYPLTGKKLIFVGLSRWGKNDEEWIPKLIHFCSKNNYDLIIKIHPIYKVSMKKIHENKINLIKKQCTGLNYKITYDIDPSLLLESADLVISDHSNLLIEGILLGKQFVIVNFQNENLDFLKKSLNLPNFNSVTTFLQLENIIMNRFSNSNNFREFDKSFLQWALEFNFLNDGKSLNRIFNLILKNQD